MRTVLITWRPFMAQVLLDWVASRGDEVVLVETTQGRPGVRGDSWRSVLELVPFEVPGIVVRHTSQAAALVESLEPDLIVSYSFPNLIDARTAAAARVAAVNVHCGRLPDYRGPNPMWAIYRGEPEIDITVHRLATEFDTGAVLAVTTAPLGPAPTPEQLDDLWSSAVGSTLDAAVARALTGDGGSPQPAGSVEILPVFAPADGDLEWTLTTRELMCRWSACAIGGVPVTVPIGANRRAVRALRVVSDSVPSVPVGRVVTIVGDAHVIAARDGLVLVQVDQSADVGSAGNGD